nr:zinc finger, CCHC-type [Tanacetum cinerariifolium]
MAGNMMKEMTTKFGKLDKFEGHDFRRWQKKMHFLLTILKVVYVLTTPMSELIEDSTVEAIRIRAKWENDDYICGGHILNGMSDSLFDVYTNVELAKELWDSLESKYMAEDSSSKKFLESLRAQDSDKGKGKEVGGPSVNMTEEGDKNKHHKQNKGKSDPMRTTVVSDPTRNQSWNVGKCGKTGQFKRDCRSGKKNNANAGDSEKGSKDQSQDQDSGATTHVCKDRCWFKTSEPVEDGSLLYMGDDHFALVHGKGSVALEFSSRKTTTLFNVLYVPKLHKNLVSGPMLNKCGYKQVYESDKYILSKSGVFVGFGYYNNGMFMLNLNKVPDDSDSVYMSSSTVVISSLWHARLGHVHYKRMLEMSKDDLIPATDENLEKCTTCRLTKITKKPFQSITRKSVILELIYSDLCDFHATPSLGNKKYVINFIDDAFRFCYVYLLHAKDEALNKFRIYKTKVELQQNDLIKTLRTDRGGEYYDPVYFQSVGIIHETIAPYTPQQNGVVKRKKRDLKKMVNSMNKTTPYELWYKKRPNFSFLRVWVYGAVVRLPDPKRKTLGEKGIDCIFVGYAEHSKAYRFYVIEPNDSISINSIIESRDAIFDDNRFSSIPRPNNIIPNVQESQRDEHSDDIPSDISEPRKGCKWIFKRKMKVDGTIDKFKARLVIQGFRQKEGIDYFDTYAPVARITTIRLLLALDAIQNLVIHQMDVKTTFLNGDLDEEVYMKQPEGFVMSGNEHKVYMGEANVILGIKIKRENKGIVITQSYYIERILKKFNREDCSPAMTSTRPDIAYAAGRLSYSDASWINHVEDSSSTSRWVFLLGGGAISWASKKQTCVTSSNMESEFVALAAAGKEAKWLRNLIHEIPIWPKPIEPISIRYDSAPTMARAYSQVYNRKSRHLGVRHSMVRELIRNGVISIEFVRTQHSLADHLTKGLVRDLVYKSVIRMGLKSI